MSSIDQDPIVDRLDVLRLRLHRRRLALGMRQRDAAAGAGLAPSHIGMIERGLRTPSLETLIALAAVYRVDLVTLMAEPDEEEVAAVTEDAVA